jgi:hypothetical protein
MENEAVRTELLSRIRAAKTTLSKHVLRVEWSNEDQAFVLHNLENGAVSIHDLLEVAHEKVIELGRSSYMQCIEERRSAYTVDAPQTLAYVIIHKVLTQKEVQKIPFTGSDDLHTFTNECEYMFLPEEFLTHITGMLLEDVISAKYAD